MSTTPATLTTDDQPELRAFVALARRLLRLIQDEQAHVVDALDALIHAYVAIVRVHPQLAAAAQRSLISATRALVRSDGAPSTAFH